MSPIEELRQKALQDAGCPGSYEIPHRCSSLHCENCGVCNMIFDFTESIHELLLSESKPYLKSCRVTRSNGGRHTDKYHPAVPVEAINRLFGDSE